jgi:hypothetical protein
MPTNDLPRIPPTDAPAATPAVTTTTETAITGERLGGDEHATPIGSENELATAREPTGAPVGRGAIDHVRLRALRQTLSRQNPESPASIPEGRYTGRKVSLVSEKGRWEKPAQRVTLRIVGGPQGGKQITGFVHGNALRILKLGDTNRDLFEFEVYIHRTDDGREYSRINVETIRLAGSSLSLGAAMRAATGEPAETAESVGGIEDYDQGFLCEGSVGASRTVVGWRATFAASCEGTGGSLASFLSAYAFGPGFLEYVQSGEGGKKVGSVAGYAGVAYSPFLPFDIDRQHEDGTPDLERARQDAVRLCGALVDRGVPAKEMLVFFTGNRGFHLQVSTGLFDARPSRGFAAITGRVCKAIGDDVGVILDHHMYRRLQSMRSPNSRHEKSGLFKVRLTLEELTTLPISDIIRLAGQPRPFPSLPMTAGPITGLVSLWSESERANQTAAAARSISVAESKGFGGITKETWDFLINGAREGERADRTFKAAANLSDFTSVEDLVTALMARPTTLCGLPPAEADGHIASAIRRAGEFRPAPRHTG